MRVLIVEDHERLAEAVASGLGARAWRSTSCSMAREAVSHAGP